jgi:hypothetical protein
MSERSRREPSLAVVVGVDIRSVEERAGFINRRVGSRGVRGASTALGRLVMR